MPGSLMHTGPQAVQKTHDPHCGLTFGLSGWKFFCVQQCRTEMDVYLLTAVLLISSIRLVALST